MAAVPWHRIAPRLTAASGSSKTANAWTLGVEDGRGMFQGYDAAISLKSER